MTIRYPGQGIAPFKGCLYGFANNLPIGNSVYPPATISTWDRTLFDTQGYYQGAGQFLIPAGEIVQAGFQGTFLTHATGNRAIHVMHSGLSIVWGYSATPACGGIVTVITAISPMQSANVDRIITFGAWQNSGGALSLMGYNANNYDACFAWIRRY